MALWLVGAAGCAAVRAPAPPPITNGVQVGVASWYGPGFHGNRTANGEIYDQYELTAAHPSLPLGTRVMVTNLENGRAVQVRVNDRGPFVMVTNLENGRAVQVRVNDRGPFVDGRAIDLSYAAARTIGMVGPGTVRVRIEVLGPTILAAAAALAAPAAAPPAPTPARPSPTAPREGPTGAYTVEVAALSDPGRAEHLRHVLAYRFPDAFVTPLAGTSGHYYRVRIGPYPLRTAALERAQRVVRLGYPAIIVDERAP